MPVLVDTSVWIGLFRSLDTAPVRKLKELVGREELLTGDLILAELLQGVKTDAEAKRLEHAFRAYPVVSLVGEAIARASAAHYRALRQQGVTVRKAIDCLVAAWCIEHRVPLLHDDRDFRPFVSRGLVEAR